MATQLRSGTSTFHFQGRNQNLQTSDCVSPLTTLELELLPLSEKEANKVRLQPGAPYLPSVAPHKGLQIRSQENWRLHLQ